MNWLAKHKTYLETIYQQGSNFHERKNIYNMLLCYNFFKYRLNSTYAHDEDLKSMFWICIRKDGAWWKIGVQKWEHKIYMHCVFQKSHAS